MQILLDYHSPYLPRAEDGRTPLDLAQTYEYDDCVKELGKFNFFCFSYLLIPARWLV